VNNYTVRAAFETDGKRVTVIQEHVEAPSDVTAAFKAGFYTAQSVTGHIHSFSVSVTDQGPAPDVALAEGGRP